jgi:hypothetical protein
MNGLKSSVDKNEFLLAAISDTQSTIRAVDVKVAALIAGLLVPFSNIDTLWEILGLIVDSKFFTLAIVLGGLFFGLWISTILLLIRTIAPLNNPATHILESSKFVGAFYGGGIFKPSFWDLFLNRKALTSKISMGDIIAMYPISEKEIGNELAFEHAKLIYIRDLKQFRLKRAITFAELWFLLGISMYFFVKFC